MSNVIADIVQLWSDMNPAAGYTSGYLEALTSLCKQTPGTIDGQRRRITALGDRVDEIEDPRLRTTATAVLGSLRTQLDMVRPSGAGPSGTGMAGVWAAADGVFYIVLKDDADKDFVPTYLDSVLEIVEYETARWYGQDFSMLVRKECLNTAAYLRGTLESLVEQRANVQAKVDTIYVALDKYVELFAAPGLDSDDFSVYWPVFEASDAAWGPMQAVGYPASLQNYYQLTQSAAEIETMAQGWLDLDMPVTTEICERIVALGIVAKMGTLQEVWDAVSKKYSIDADQDEIKRVEDICNAYGAAYIIGFNPKVDRVDFTTTPSYLVNLVTGGEDFAVNYLDPTTAYSQLYLTQAKNTSLLTMINILVHEASHGYNFVLSAKHAGSPLLNVNTALEVAMTEGMAFYREYQYWAAAQNLLGLSDLNEVQSKYLGLYGDTPEAQAEGVLCAQLETYVWRVVRYIRALCDVRVNGGKMTYTSFIAWAAKVTGLSMETLHGECFTFMAMPGYAPCYAVGGVSYSTLQKRGIHKGVSERDFNTYASQQGFYAWPVAEALLEAFVESGGTQS